jgi:hypothetical protein
MPPSSPPPPADHAHAPGDRCAHGGQPPGVERSYSTNDRLAHVLLVALCKQHGVTAYRKTKAATRVYVVAPDAATLDRLEARLAELLPKLDAALRPALDAFVREHTGVTLPAPGTR